jgi:16S rRNA (guanine1207-N2)-methyltransferase
LTGLDTALDATGGTIPAEKFDLVLANPPYFSHYRIAELFLQTARKALKPGGVVNVVTKAPNWFIEHMPELFDDVAGEFVKDYAVVTGRRSD